MAVMCHCHEVAGTAGARGAAEALVVRTGKGFAEGDELSTGVDEGVAVGVGVDARAASVGVGFWLIGATALWEQPERQIASRRTAKTFMKTGCASFSHRA